MGKAGWQIATAVCGSLALMMGALAFNSARALDVANAQLRTATRVETSTCPVSDSAIAQPSDVDAEEMRRVNNEMVRSHPHVTKCIDGEAYVKFNGEWRQNGPC